MRKVKVQLRTEKHIIYKSIIAIKIGREADACGPEGRRVKQQLEVWAEPTAVRSAHDVRVTKNAKITG